MAALLSLNKWISLEGLNSKSSSIVPASQNISIVICDKHLYIFYLYRKFRIIVFYFFVFQDMRFLHRKTQYPVKDLP